MGELLYVPMGPGQAHTLAHNEISKAFTNGGVLTVWCRALVADTYKPHSLSMWRTLLSFPSGDCQGVSQRVVVLVEWRKREISLIGSLILNAWAYGNNILLVCNLHT